MGCFHGHAIADCPDRRCQGQENTQDDFDVAVSRLASDREQLVRDRIDLLDEIVRCSAPALTWEKSALDACFPGLHGALSALKKAEDAK